MTTLRTAPAREKLIKAGIERIRTHGYAATTVDHICEDAGVTKGAFFHHFDSKEALAEACIRFWDERSVVFDAAAPYRAISDAGERLAAGLAFYGRMFSNPKVVTSCLVGTTVQEVADSHPRLREAARTCFGTVEVMFSGLISEAAVANGRTVDAGGLARLWLAGIQGSLILFKASQDATTTSQNLEHLREYICGCAGVTVSRSDETQH